MASRKKAAKRGAKAKRPARAKPPARRRAKPAPKRTTAPGAKARAAPRTRGAKARAVAPRTALPHAPRPLTEGTLALVLHEPLREEALAALRQGEKVQLIAGISEEGGPVETLVFGSGGGLQSSGVFVHRGAWSGTRLVTDKGHLLDPDGNCFCRDCETAGGYTVDDDE